MGSAYKIDRAPAKLFAIDIIVSSDRELPRVPARCKLANKSFIPLSRPIDIAIHDEGALFLPVPPGEVTEGREGSRSRLGLRHTTAHHES
jgi:hypothetical protein